MIDSKAIPLDKAYELAWAEHDEIKQTRFEGTYADPPKDVRYHALCEWQHRWAKRGLRVEFSE